VTYDGIRVPVLDLYGANELPRVLEGAASRKASLQGKALSKQVVIPDTDHFFANREDAMVKAVKDFLDSVK
jgi:alpha/beta superfamily hydrolase